MQSDYPIRSYDKKTDRKPLSELLFDFTLEAEYRGHVSLVLSADIHDDISSLLNDLDKGINHWCSVCHDSSSLVGFITYQRYSNDADEVRKKGVVEIESYVMPEYRGNGIGTLLKEEAIEQIKRLKQDRYPDISRIVSAVRTDNHPNIRILEKLKFRKGREYEGCNGSTYRYYFKKV